MEKTLVIIKPDGVRRGLIGEIISRYERKGLKIVEMKMVDPKQKTLMKHYHDHIEKDFFQELVQFMMSGKIVVMVVEGSNAVETVRKINGKTNPSDAENGSIRGDYAYSMTENIIHGSDSKENAEKEIKIWFDNKA